jgi:hypothetical protein
MPLTNLFMHYLPIIKELPVGRPYTKEELLTDKFLLYKEDKLEMYYAPHNEYIPSQARIVLIGITPGWAEMELAFRTARIGLELGLDSKEIAKRVKIASQFTGATRLNIIAMLNSLGLHTKLGIPSCADLFEADDEMLYSTAMLGYPVFAAGRNYNGHSPALQAVPFLKNWAIESLSAELAQMERPLLIPLGKAVEEVLRTVVTDGKADSRQCLWGFPHPSGANGHRRRLFEEVCDQLRERIAEFP